MNRHSRKSHIANSKAVKVFELQHCNNNDIVEMWARVCHLLLSSKLIPFIYETRTYTKKSFIIEHTGYSWTALIDE